jgi:arylsulfatase A-like enzyme
MSTATAICRVIIVVLDGLRPDAIDTFALSNIRAMAQSGASTMRARTVSPSCTWPAITSLLSGMPPEVHGILRDSPHVPRPKTALEPLPALLSRAGYHSAVFMRALPALYRGTARLIAKGLGFGEARFAGRTATEVTMAASTNLRSQERGLIVLHWADADQAGESHGWMTREYGDACQRLDSAFGLLTQLTSCSSDPHTLLIALADHGGGGVTVNDHSEEHHLNWTIPLILGGGSVRCTPLEEAHLLDIPATAAWALGVTRPAAYAGRVLAEAITGSDEEQIISEAAAVA